MKRICAVIVFLAAVTVLSKLAFKPATPADSRVWAPVTSAHAQPAHPESMPDAKTELLSRYQSSPADVRNVVARVADRFGANARQIDQTDGLRGLQLLDQLDIEAIFLYEKHPADFRRLCDLLGSRAAADILLHWREYFGLKRADLTDRRILITEIASLSPAAQRLAARYPSALPLILADPRAVTELAARMAGNDTATADMLAMLSFISLEQGPSDLRTALKTFEKHGPLALEAFRRHGLDGFALVKLYGPVLEAMGESLPLDQSLILVRVNADYIDELLQTHRPETVAGHLRHVAAAGLTELVGGSTSALRLVVEFGLPGERALAQAGPDAADVVYGDFTDATLRRQAVAALAAYGSMALAMLDKYAADADFRAILQAHGAAVIPPIAQADAGPETLAYLGSKAKKSITETLALAALFATGDNGQAVIRTIKNEGLARVAQLNQTGVQFYQFLPLYDVIHLGNVLRRGYAPTSGEMTWAVVDGCFVIADALSLAALQPEAAVAAESVRSELKAAVKASARSVSRELTATGGEAAAKAGAKHETAHGLERSAAHVAPTLSPQLARWWTVRSAGGMYHVLRRIPEALPHLSLAEMTHLSAPLCTKAGLRLTTWRPLRLLQDGAEVVLRIPPQKGLKYLAAQAAQAGVGVIGFQKMEEHLSSKRQ